LGRNFYLRINTVDPLIPHISDGPCFIPDEENQEAQRSQSWALIPSCGLCLHDLTIFQSPPCGEPSSRCKESRRRQCLKIEELRMIGLGGCGCARS
uniref:Uncharacterized protein n=1 Tax=Mustela putorius furo TaxID=9669 RepID=M3Y4L3_MUSPF